MTSPRIHVSYHPDHPDLWTLEQDYVRETSIGQITVPKGFVTDLASTPFQLWARFPRWGPWSGAAIVHDKLYFDQPPGITRRQADLIFLELMKADGVPPRDRNLLFTAVDTYGDGPWNRNQEPVAV